MQTDSIGAKDVPAVDNGKRERSGDGGFLCRIALRASQLWDFIDARDIDKHAVSITVLIGTVKVTQWAFTFAELHMDKSGVELAAVIAAVIGPYSLLQGAAIKWYFEARA